MKTWMKAIPLVAGLALLASALATPVRADDDDDDDDRGRRGHYQLSDHRSHGKHHGHKGYKQGYKQGYKHSKKHARRHGGKHGHGHRHGHRKHYKHGGHGHGQHYGHRHHRPNYGYGYRHYRPYPAFVFRYYHDSRYEAPAERYPHAQPDVRAIAATTVARDESLPETCLMTREYQTEITIGGEVLEAYGQACLQPDGSWQRGPAVAAR